MKVLKIIGIALLSIAVIFGVLALCYEVIPSFAEWVDNLFKAKDEVIETVENFKLLIKR